MLARFRPVRVAAATAALVIAALPPAPAHAWPIIDDLETSSVMVLTRSLQWT